MAKQEIYDEHSELFHYTNFKGVSGILETQTLWATHYKSLNDTTELQLMRPRLARRLFSFMKELSVEKYRNGSFKEKTKIRKLGGTIKVAREAADVLANTFFQVAFESSDRGEALAIPFITAFCAHTSDQEYEQRNGLLSQWRGYAAGGFALVFDTRKLIDLYKKELTFYLYASGHMGSVIYENDESGFEKEFADTIKNIKRAFLDFTENGYMGVEKIFGDVLSMFTRFKHRAFYEEREVRAVSFPMTPAIENRYKQADPDYTSPKLPMKKIHFREDGAAYIASFDFEPRKNLPIKRIIVGPQRDQAAAKKKVQSLIGSRKIDVICSNTPYRSNF